MAILGGMGRVEAPEAEEEEEEEELRRTCCPRVRVERARRGAIILVGRQAGREGATKGVSVCASIVTIEVLVTHLSDLTIGV